MFPPDEDEIPVYSSPSPHTYTRFHLPEKDELTMQDYLPTLKAFVEGFLNQTQFQSWLAENTAIESQVGRLRYLQLKYKSYEPAIEILNESGIQYIPSYKRCPTCHEPLLFIDFNGTPSEDLAVFAQRNTTEHDLPTQDGRYCPNGCTWEAYEPPYRPDWDAIFEATRPCHITVRANDLPLRLTDYKIYLNGNIYRTRDKDRQEDNVEYMLLEPGEHRIVVREFEVQKPNRQESNTIWFTVTETFPAHFEVCSVDGSLVLRQLIGNQV